MKWFLLVVAGGGVRWPCQCADVKILLANREPSTHGTNPKAFESANEFPLLSYSGRDLFLVSLSGNDPPKLPPT
jgi:hypothetical protein